MSRNLSPLMRPTSLQPSLRGPRDVAPPRVHSIATPEERAADTTAAAPTPTEPKDKTMTNAQRILAALKKRSPLDLTHLEAATGISRGVLGVTLPALVKNESIERSPHQKGVYGLPGTEFPTVAPAKAGAQPKPAKATKRTPKSDKKLVKQRARVNEAAGSFAAGVAQIEREMGTDLHPARLAAPMATASPFDSCADRIFDATAIPCRAIATANGGAIVLRGNQLTAELNAEELNVLHQLRG